MLLLKNKLDKSELFSTVIQSMYPQCLKKFLDMTGVILLSHHHRCDFQEAQCFFEATLLTHESNIHMYYTQDDKEAGIVRYIHFELAFFLEMAQHVSRGGNQSYPLSPCHLVSAQDFLKHLFLLSEEIEELQSI